MNWEAENRRIAAELPLQPASMTAVVLDALTAAGYRVVKQPLTDPELPAPDQSGSEIGKRPSGVAGSLLALADLRKALATIHLPSPAYARGAEPTAADACANLLDHIEWQLRQIHIFIGVHP